MRHLLILLALVPRFTCAQLSQDDLLGIYESTSNGFEWHSTMVLEENNRFRYKSGLGGCQVEVTGTWVVVNQKLRFTNDNEFLDDGTIQYPNLALVPWTIKKDGIKPDGLLDRGFCLKTNKLHRKK